ncbi:MAG: glycosyltransferase family 4 protein [Candidatus Vogelbacteria bacterium]|nr:glycosyltransferase family 4 protein [Candidatus Vogelbacteria bacterium]
MRILMIGWEFPPQNSGGLGTACQGLTRALASAGAELIFVLPRCFDVRAPWQRVIFADGAGSFDCRTIKAALSPYLTARGYARRRAGADPLYGPDLISEVYRYAAAAADLTRGERFDLIHAHDWLSFPAGLRAKEVSGKPLIVHVHATEFDRTGGNGVNPEVYAIEKEGMTRADRVVTVSQFTKNLVTRHYGVPDHKVTVVHNGIDFETKPRLDERLAALKRRGERLVLFVGRITLQKGPDYFLSAARRVIDLEPGVTFVMAGSGDMAGQIVEQAAALGLGQRFIFAGFLRGDELDAIYQAADLLVMPSVSEPFGLTPLESLSNGTPVLVSRQSGVSEVLRHALKVDFWDVEEMANQIIAVLRHPPLKRTLAAYGQADARRVTWSAAAEKCLNIYRSLVGAV